MHESVMEWLVQVAEELPRFSFALEVGSYNENGSPREVFADRCAAYTGIDQRAGRDVDLVAEAADLPYGDGSFDLVICAEMLEHDPRPWLSVAEMGRVLRPGGHLLLTARGFGPYGGYPEHPCPEDYWRFNRSSFRVLLEDAGFQILELVDDSGKEAPGVFAHATRL